MSAQGQGLQIKIDKDAVEVIELLKNKSTKSIFISEAIKSYSKTKESKVFLNAKSISG